MLPCHLINIQILLTPIFFLQYHYAYRLAFKIISLLLNFCYYRLQEAARDGRFCNEIYAI